jgi:EmrB/QacA subfamily drug resistance transporter
MVEKEMDGPQERAFAEQDPNYKWKVLSTVVFGIFMVILDTTVVNVAFQTIRQEFGGNINESQWVISIYVLALGITTPLAGFLADRFGAKKIYLGGLGLFAVGSLLCGISPSLGLLIAARALQGMGGGIAMPLGTALLLQAFPPREHGTALGLFGIAALIAPAVGPILGGWLVDLHLWRMIFFINPPIGLIGVVLGFYFLRQTKREVPPGFDTIGVVSEIIGFGSILYAASIAADQGWAASETLIFFGIGVAGLLVFGYIELKRAKSPLLDLRLFKNRIFLNATVLGYVSTVALFGAEFLMPVYLQMLRGNNALQTGWILLPMAIAAGICVTLSGKIYDKIGPRPLLVVGFGLLMVNTWQLSQIEADTPINWIIFLLILRGLALGLTVQTTLVTALSVVPPRDLARGSSLTNATRFVVQSIGVAILATVLASTLSPEVKAVQNQFLEQRATAGMAAAPGAADPPAASSQEFAGLCANSKGPESFGGVKVASLTIPSAARSTNLPYSSIIDQACQENIAGFERAYLVTFYAAGVALLLAAFLPGWPGKWVGRQG